MDVNTQHWCLKKSAKNGTSSMLQLVQNIQNQIALSEDIQIVKNLLTKAKQSGKDPYLATPESRNYPVENSSSPAQLIYGRFLRSLLSIYQEKLKIKSISDDNIQDQKV